MTPGALLEGLGPLILGSQTTSEGYLHRGFFGTKDETKETTRYRGGKSSAPAPKGGLAGADDFPSGPWSTLEYPGGGPRPPRAGPQGPE